METYQERTGAPFPGMERMPPSVRTVIGHVDLPLFFGMLKEASSKDAVVARQPEMGLPAAGDIPGGAEYPPELRLAK